MLSAVGILLVFVGRLLGCADVVTVNILVNIMLLLVSPIKNRAGPLRCSGYTGVTRGDPIEEEEWQNFRYINPTI